MKVLILKPKSRYERLELDMDKAIFRSLSPVTDNPDLLKKNCGLIDYLTLWSPPKWKALKQVSSGSWKSIRGMVQFGLGVAKSLAFRNWRKPRSVETFRILFQSVLIRDPDLSASRVNPTSLGHVICHPVDERCLVIVVLEADASDSLVFFELLSLAFVGGLS
ncbi:hypothetical protein Tco_0593465 [Tanacetum coccineum]